MHPLSSVEQLDPDALPAGTTRADFCTGRYRIEADVHTGDRRLLDLLRDNTRQYLEIRRIRVRAIDADDSRPLFSEGLLHKADVAWALILAEPSRAEARLYGFVKKVPVRVSLILDSHRIDGNVFVESTATDPVSFFLRGIEKSGERFLAVGSPTISSSLGSVDEAGVVIVNRSVVRVFSVIR